MNEPAPKIKVRDQQKIALNMELLSTARAPTCIVAVELGIVQRHGGMSEEEAEDVEERNDALHVAL